LRAFVTFHEKTRLDVSLEYSRQEADIGDNIQYRLSFKNRSAEYSSFSVHRSLASGESIEIPQTLVGPFEEKNELIVERVASGTNHVVSGLSIHVKNAANKFVAIFELDSFSLPVARPQRGPVTNTITNTVTIQGRGVVDASGISVEGRKSSDEKTSASIASTLVTPSFSQFLPLASSDPYTTYVALALPLYDQLSSIPGVRFDYPRPKSDSEPLLTLESLRNVSDLHLTASALRHGDRVILVSEVTSAELFSLDSEERVLLVLGTSAKKFEFTFPVSSLAVPQLVAKFFQISATES
jgi:hypothetical protein